MSVYPCFHLIKTMLGKYFAHCFLVVVVLYHVDVTTGLESAANPGIHVFIQLYGSNGDSGRRLLHKSSTNASCFLSGQTDSFELEAVFLGDLAKLTISHSTITPGDELALPELIM